MRRLSLIFAVLVLITPAWAEEAAFPGKVSDFAGFARHDFDHEGLKCRQGGRAQEGC